METKEMVENKNERKVYTSPELVAYGNIADLTKANPSGPDDFDGGGTFPETIAPQGYLP
jgi:hypothetical protein